MAGNSGGPWGGNGSGSNRPTGNNDDDRGNRRPSGQSGQVPPEVEEMLRAGQERFRVLMGGGNGGSNGSGGQGGGGPEGIRGMFGLGALAAIALWAFSSFYTVKPEEKSVELFLGEFYSVGDSGLNFAPWPLVTYEVLPVTREQTESIGIGGRGSDAGLMLTGDENIVDIDFNVVWNIKDAAEFLFNLRDPEQTIRAVSESAMREIIAQSELAPILNRDRDSIKDRLALLIQDTLDGYESGINIVRVNFDRADPPAEVIDSFREVQAAEQTRDTLQKQADAYANRVVAAARGEAAQLLEQAEGYRAQVVNEAEGEAARFLAVFEEYEKAQDITRKRLYLETLEKVMTNIDKVILDEAIGGGSGVVPYLPLNELNKSQSNSGGSN